MLAIIVAVLASTLRTHSASAHPLGNFTINQYARIEATTDGLRLVYVLDMAEIPAFQEIQTIDTDGDGNISVTENETYLATTLPEITRQLHLAVDGQDLPLTVDQQDLTFPEGQAGLKLLRLRTVFVAATPALGTISPLNVTYRTDFDADRIGWKEIVVTHGAGIALDAAGVATTDTSDELRAYPQDMLKSPLDQTEASFGLTIQPGAPAAPEFARFAAGEPEATTGARPNGGSTGAHFAALLNGNDLTKTGIVLALLLAAVWGSLHALSPGHGKTVVGAYLVGSRGTPRHAVFLGLTVTVTHTAGVLALGMITLFASHYVVPERLYPWMSVASGLMVIAMGLFTLRQRLRGQPAFGHHHHGHSHDHSHDHPHDHSHDHPHDHDHDHDHEHHHHSKLEARSSILVHTHGGSTHSHLPPGTNGTRVTWRTLLALGVSGGLIPCPSALVVLLGSIALGRVGFGLALVVAFSLGLAATLTSLGLVFLYAGRFLERRVRPTGRTLFFLRYAPALGSIALTLAGVAIIVRALEQTGFR
ncbi:MAG TPA: sulfite exporter TauE/SafE family protein [Thermomicrobiales bacterium]